MYHNEMFGVSKFSTVLSYMFCAWLCYSIFFAIYAVQCAVNRLTCASPGVTGKVNQGTWRQGRFKKATEEKTERSEGIYHGKSSCVATNSGD